MTQKLRLYGIARSRAFRNIWCLEELGVPYEQVAIGFDGTANRTPDFLRINPNGKVPALVDGPFKLWESLAINLYLAKKHGAGTLYPKLVEDEARCWQWSFWTASEVERPLGEWGYNTIVLPEKERDPGKARAALEALGAPFSVLDGELGQRGYLADAKAFTIADLNLASVMFRAWAHMDLAKRPNIKRWLDVCYSRPAARKALAIREG
jgi:glutathione S-transferase